MLNQRIYIGLLHYPVQDKSGKIVTASLVTLDLHDLARLSRTYNLGGFYAITPLLSQLKLGDQIIQYWSQGFGSNYNLTRKESFTTIKLVQDLETAIFEIYLLWQRKVFTIGTTAREMPDKERLKFKEASKIIFNCCNPILILLGTAWGITSEVLSNCDYILEPIFGYGNHQNYKESKPNQKATSFVTTKNSYNHLSVRTAAAIIIDRLLNIDFI